MVFDMKGIDLSRLALYSVGDHSASPEDHFVEIYEDDSSLIDSLRTFVAIGINDGEAAIVVADPAHLAALGKVLDASFDLDDARQRGLYLGLDAEETLASFIEHGMPNEKKFNDVLDGLFDRVTSAGGKVRIFGEMVSVLWERGDVSAAIALEDLWNRLAERHSFSLFCAYRAAAFDGVDEGSLGAVISRHSHVILAPAEGS
jgi:hypothetical protein